MLFERFELSSEPTLRHVKTLTQRAPTSVSWRCTRCVVVCEKSEIASVEEGHDDPLQIRESTAVVFFFLLIWRF